MKEKSEILIIKMVKDVAKKTELKLAKNAAKKLELKSVKKML